MNVRLNLAPEVYQASQRAKQRKQLATSIGVLVSAVSVGIVVVSLIILGGQKVLLAALNNSVKQRQNKVSQYAELGTAATAQQHLQAWSQLAGTQGHFSNFFQILQDFAPQGVAATQVSVDNTNTITMTGDANSYDLVTKFAKALEASNVQVGPSHAATNQPYFTNVQLSNVSNNGSDGIGFQLTTTMSSEVTSGQ
ncbi:MAG TPA: PilN domain-containing protein [Candidatus Saccharimonadales bacterium]|nr:PilN domain-containing protein [Candidatus Saccharimonadales bacterium]